jgi:hypothetical protein
MGFRKILETWGLGVLIAGGVGYVVFVTFHEEISNASSCDSTAPANAAQSAALQDLKSRTAVECEGPGQSCQYLISEQVDGSIIIKFYPIGGATGSECMAIDCCYEEHIYTVQGQYVRCDGCAA